MSDPMNEFGKWDEPKVTREAIYDLPEFRVVDRETVAVFHPAPIKEGSLLDSWPMSRMYFPAPVRTRTVSIELKNGATSLVWDSFLALRRTLEAIA